MNTSALSNQSKLLGAVTIVGAVLMVLHFVWLGRVADLPNLANSTVPRALLLVVASLCLMAGPTGLHSVRVWSGTLGTVGMTLTLIGMLLWVVAAFYFIANPDQEFNQLISPAGGFAQSIGMILIGIATLRSKVLRGGNLSYRCLPAFSSLCSYPYRWLSVSARAFHLSTTCKLSGACSGSWWAMLFWPHRDMPAVTRTMHSLYAIASSEARELVK